MKRIWFIRHGETDWNREGRLQGQRDIPLNDLGREQAAEAGRRLLAAAPEAARLPWLVSPLGRTVETATLARAAIGLDPPGFVTDARLMEITFGRWEGNTWHELKKRERELAKARKADKWNFVPPAGRATRCWLSGLPHGWNALRMRRSLCRMAGLQECCSPCWPDCRRTMLPIRRSGRAKFYRSFRVGMRGFEGLGTGSLSKLHPFMQG